MPANTPRQRLAEAVAALDAAMQRDPLGANALSLETRVLAAARAMLAASDDAAELRAVKALMEQNNSENVCFQVFFETTDKGEHFGATRRKDGCMYTAPTATELCKKLGVPHE